MKKTILSCLAVLAALLPAAAQDPQPAPCISNKKVITLGFSSLNTRELRDHVAIAEQYIPADGMVIHMTANVKVDGKPFQASRHTVFKGVTWKREWFREAEADLKATGFRRFTDNFLYIATSGYNSNLFDDRYWESICSNAGMLADIAKKNGLKGIFFDIEHYGGAKLWPVFKFDPNGGKSFAECQKQARKRGREMMRAIAGAYPDITMVAVLGSYSINFPALGSPDLNGRLQSELYGLSPAFFDGMFDELPPQGRLYDGYEFYGYKASGENDYRRLAHNFLTMTPLLCAPELRTKVMGQSGLAAAMYMECYTNKKGFWRLNSPHMDQTKLFRRNLHAAIRAASAYTWIYYDAAAKWYPIRLGKVYEQILAKNGGGKARLWSELLPGLNDAMRAARNPLAYAREQLKNGKAKLIRKVDFEDGKLNMVPWSSGKAGRIGVDKTQGASGSASASLVGVKFGSIHFIVRVKPGELYLLRAKAKNARPETKLTLSGKFDPVWTAETGFSKPDANGWMQAETTVFVPDDGKNLTVSCGAEVKTEAGSDCRFDDIELYLID